MPKVLEIHVTTPDVERAEQIARTLVAERLAACVTILPGVRSIYRWEGEIHTDEEVLCLIKARADGFAALADRVKALHPYQVPEILAFEVTEGSPAYLEWLAAEAAPLP